MKYSVIIPVYNEQDSVGPVYSSINKVMLHIGAPYEIIFIDDGSQDKTLEVLKKLAQEVKDLSVISLDHIGKSGALQAGFDGALGEIIITMDGDGQDEPLEILKLLNKMAEGYDVVAGWRKDRQDNLMKKISSQTAAFVRRIFTRDQFHDLGCALRVFQKKDIQNIYLSRGFHRFFILIMEKMGYRVAEVEIIHRVRKTGVSKYGVWNRLGESVIDLYLLVFTDFRRLMAKMRTH